MVTWVVEGGGWEYRRGSAPEVGRPSGRAGGDG